MTEMRCDVAIIGAGTAGLAAERAARKAGAKTPFVDDGIGGTTCATVGCMPSKLLIAAANATHRVRQAATFGIRTPPPTVDGPAVMTRLREPCFSVRLWITSRTCSHGLSSAARRQRECLDFRCIIRPSKRD
jgi:pyruvate/2-oxoglutarate dehydrogenase complex dihydrolipoamide dehydrogenase (E3) component